MIGAERHDPRRAVQLLVDERGELGQLPIGAAGDVLHFQAMRPEGMPHIIVRGKIDGQQIGHFVLRRAFPRR